MVLVVKNVHKISVEGVNVIKLREAFYDACEFLIDRLLHELDLSHVELPDTGDLEILMDFCWGLALSL